MQHLMNKHNDRNFKCDRCDFTGAFQWQLTHHQKNCGLEYECLTCGVKYNKTALLMHCRRKNHECIFSDTKKKAINGEEKSQPIMSAIVNGHLYTPVVSLPSDSLPFLITNHRPILPKLPNQNYEKRSISTETDLKFLRKSANKSKRSAEVQTVKKYYRSNRKKDSKSAETQTLDSSFKVPLSIPFKTETEQSLVIPECLEISKKVANNSKSCFTQTFDCESNSCMSLISPTALLDDPYWDAAPKKLNPASNSEQSVQTDAFESEPLFPLSGNHITTAQTQTSITDCDLFSTLFSSTLNDSMDGLTFHDYDLEFLDIETQTNWNFDQTTQTEHNFFDQLFD